MLKAHLSAPVLSLFGRSDRGYSISIAIAYYDNGQWISEGWTHLKPNSTEVLLNQSLKERYYYYYIEQNMGMLALDTGIGFTRVHYHLSHQYSVASSCFWLSESNFKKSNAKYSSGGFERFFDNVFNGGKWVHGWYLVDVGNSSDYTIHFELERHSSSHYHYPHH
ncbi:DUF1036 domain-containing protein [Aerosakkonemataceae cyanobacterium BLCC-F50]|uniref:DUF1036 domain-containing protein n=1 Tax=Floridaenema flaviceps BLCC-F50 TaxID=3153642 RepID=A0ABV4XXB6_9CYAN